MLSKSSFIGVHLLLNHLRELLQVGDDSVPLLSQSAWFCRLLGNVFTHVSNCTYAYCHNQEHEGNIEAANLLSISTRTSEWE